ncbi:MAG: hypothetical protein U5K54_05395 [Cytophagales bacterium]|nr:hypothetical protein [Cytophagales bacterium]
MNKPPEGNVLSEYHIEASIASVHALAPSFKETNWDKLVILYHLLMEYKPGPMTSLNYAIAIGYSFAPERGIAELDKIESLKGHYLLFMRPCAFLFSHGGNEVS